MRLRVRSIQRFCLRDGPGIRTTVFLQGCPLRCWWCHNPEMQPRESPDARDYGVEELSEELERDARYWRSSGGGVTLSGGEPLLQPEPVAALLEVLGAHGHHRAVDTAGAVESRAVRTVAPHVDLWLWDVKSVDGERLREGTGARGLEPLENLRRVLADTASPVTVRVPLISGFNEDEVPRIAEWLSRQPRSVAVEILPGHDLSGGKSRGAHRSHSPAATPQEVDAARRALREAGLRVVSDGMDDQR